MKTIISTRPKAPSAPSSFDRPREDEHRLDVEHHEQQGVHVVPDVRLAEAADGVGARLVGDVLLGLGPVGRSSRPSPSMAPTIPSAATDEDGDREVLPVVLGHDVGLRHPLGSDGVGVGALDSRAQTCAQASSARFRAIREPAT